jgi:flagellar assembly protein FliH
MRLFERVRPPSATMEPFPPIAEAAPDPGVATVATVFPDFGRAPGAEAEGAPSAADLDALRRAAYEEGVAAGRAAAEREVAVPAAALTEALAELARFRAGLLERYQRELLELAIGIARKVVQRELAEHPEHWLGMIREAVRHVLDRERIRIRVGSVLHRFLVAQLPALRDLLEGVQELDLVEDPALAENGCVIESHYGELDLGVDGQMSAIRAALTGGR